VLTYAVSVVSLTASVNSVIDVRSSQGAVWYSCAQKMVICG